MSRRRSAAVLAAALVLATGCSDNAPTRTRAFKGSKAVQAVEDLPNTVEGMIKVLFDKPAAPIMQIAWQGVKFSLQRNHKEIARLKMFLMAEATTELQKRNRLRDPDGAGSATVAQGVAKLFSLMFGTVFPELPRPPQLPGGDAVVVLVDGRAQTAVTPAKQAGIQIPAGSTNTPFFLVIEEDTTPYLRPCQGPLNTTRCQFPLFYKFTPYPHVRLLKQAKFGVCSMHHGPRGPSSEAQHDRLRLAHNASGRTTHPVVEGIEVLPLVSVDFLDCSETHYPPPPRIGSRNPLLRGLSYAANRLGGGLARILTPKNAFALDRGGGGETDFFSPFNVVDTMSALADLAPFHLSAFPGLVLPGDAVDVTYSVKNIGAALASASNRRFVLASDPALTVGVQELAAASVPALAPGDSDYVAESITIPDVAPGTYYLGVRADDPSVIGESVETNNVASIAITVPVEADDNTFDLASQGTATVDGVLGGAEWANGVCKALTFNVPDEGTTTGKVCVMSDATNLYLGLSFVRAVLDPGNSLSYEFDNDASGTLNAGDDGIILNPSLGFKDLVRYLCETETGGTSLCSTFDETFEGTNDGAAVFNRAGNITTYEMRHPLNSGDTHDFARAPGDQLRFFLSLRMIKEGGTFPSGFGDTNWPGFGQFATIILAPSTP